MLYWNISTARQRLTSELFSHDDEVVWYRWVRKFPWGGELISERCSEGDEDRYVVIRDGSYYGRDMTAVLVEPKLFMQYQEIARWHWLQEVARHPRLAGNVDLRDDSSWQKSSIARRLHELIEQQQREDARQIPELSEEDFAALDASITEVVGERESPVWSRPSSKLAP